MTRLRVGVLLGERPDLLDALLGMDVIEVVAVARDRREPKDGFSSAARRELVRWWPERSPGARERREAETAAWFAAREVDLVVTAGWLWLLGPVFLGAFPGWIVNVHPTLLPAFPGRHSVERATEHGVRVHGVTVHLVDEGVDTGPILAQAALHIQDDPDAAEVRRRLAPLESRVLVDAVRALAVPQPANSRAGSPVTPGAARNSEPASGSSPAWSPSREVVMNSSSRLAAAERAGGDLPRGQLDRPRRARRRASSAAPRRG